MEYQDFLEQYDQLSIELHYLEERFYMIRMKKRMFGGDEDGLVVFIKEVEELRSKVKEQIHLLKQDFYRLKEIDYSKWLKLQQEFSSIWYNVNMLENEVIEVYEELKEKVIPDRRNRFFEENTSILPFALASTNPVEEIKIEGMDNVKFKDEELGHIRVSITKNMIEFFDTHERYNLLNYIRKIEGIPRSEVGNFLSEIYKDTNNKYTANLYEPSSESKCKCGSIANQLTSRLDRYEDFNVDKINLMKRLAVIYSNIRTLSNGEPIEFKHRKKQKYIKL